ncbi:MAG: hypothetical protein M0R06_26800 [Sphaerochaeta sp.]|jgi:hypothetical protein|nr:hypothetical protein [Sphaerochaeta sp.]
MTLEEKIRGCIERHPDWDTKRISNSTGGSKADVEAVRRGESIAPRSESPFAPPPPGPSLPQAPPPRVKAIPLAGVHLLSKKPVDQMKGRLYSLERGMGYPVSELARAWCVSEDTLKTHANKHRALAYVEATPGEYVPVIVHPETPRGDLS